MKLIFELGVEGRGMTLMPECDVPEYQLPEERSEALRDCFSEVGLAHFLVNQ